MTSRPFLVPAASLLRHPTAAKKVEAEGVFSDLRTVAVGVAEDEPVAVRVTLSAYPGGIMAAGRVRSRWSGECRRCGGPARGVIDVGVRERFEPRGSSTQDEDAYPLDGDDLDLEPLVRDTVMLELPLAPLCRPDCLGICPTCGADRNEDPCSCTAPTDPRWTALDVLRDP